MKTKLLFTLLFLASAAFLSAATNDLTALLQQGLLDEEATHDLHGAITDYQAVAAQFDKDREIAATAIYRLGECYRKLGQTNEAVTQYQRILREFPAQTTLVTLSQQNLRGLGPTTGEAAAPNAALAELLKKRDEDKSKLAIIQGSQGPGHPLIQEATDAESQKIQELQAMLNNSPDLINASEPNGPPLAQAAFADQLRVATFLLDNKADVNLGPSLGEKTPLMVAAQHGHKAMAELLLARGADVNVQSREGFTALDEAALRGYTAVVEVLLAHHADVNATNNQGRTALSFAIGNGSAELIKLFLVNKADPNIGSFDLPLLSAVAHKNIDTATVLLQAGANPNLASAFDNVPNTGGTPETPLSLAVYLKQPALVQLLLHNKADPNTPQHDGHALIFDAVTDASILTDLLDAGARLDVITSYPNYNSKAVTPLDLAVQYNAADSVKVLLKRGANPNGLPSASETPLHWVAENVANTNIALLLLDAEADPNVRGSDGRTPLDILKSKLSGQNSSGFRGGIGVPAPPAFPSVPSSANQATVAALINCLRQHGALDVMPNPNSISISRPSANFVAHVVQREGTNDPNHFTLLEILSMQGKFLAAYPGDGRMVSSTQFFWNNMPLGFPDLAHLHIRHPSADFKTWNEQIVDITACFNSGDSSKDVPLEWGDVVEIPETDHSRNEPWPHFSIAQMANLRACLTRHVSLIVNGKTNSITLSPPDFVTNGVTFPQNPGLVSMAYGTPYWLKPVLLNSSLVLASSDLAHVHVTRRDPKSGQTQRWVFDCSDSARSTSALVQESGGPGFIGNSPVLQPGQRSSFAVPLQTSVNTDFWLRDGDIIEIPEKQ
jgi:uncharacterized protein